MDNKRLIEEVAARMELSKKDAASLLSALADAMLQAAKRSDSVAVPAFGCFEPKKRNERVMVMPTTGRRMLIPPKVSLTFRTSALLKQKLRGIKPSNTEE